MAIPYKLIKLDKERKLRLGMGVLVDFEQLTGVKFTELENTTPDIAAKLAWVMFKQEDKDLTLEKTCELIDEYYDGSITDFIKEIEEAVYMAFPQIEGEPKNAKTPMKTSMKKGS